MGKHTENDRFTYNYSYLGKKCASSSTKCQEKIYCMYTSFFYQSQDLLTLEIQTIKKENWMLRKQNYILYKNKEYYKDERDHLTKVIRLWHDWTLNG